MRFPIGRVDHLPLRSEEQSPERGKPMMKQMEAGWLEPHLYVTVAAPTNDQNLCDLKQHQCVSLHLWKSEMQKLVQWAKIKVPAGLHSFREVSGENPFCCLFQLLENILHLGDIHSPSWRHPRHLRDSASNLWFSYLILLSSTSSSTTTLPGAMHKDFVITPEWSRYSRNICHLIVLITFVK